MSSDPDTRDGRNLLPAGVRVALYLLAFFVVVTLVRDARAVVVPVLVAVFLAVLGAPVMRWLTSHRVAPGLAAGCVILLMFGALAITGTLLTTSLQQLTARIPTYQQQFDQRIAELAGSGDPAFSVRDVTDKIDAGAAMRFVAGLLGDLLGVLGNTFLILVIVAFMLIEASSFPDKLRAAFGESPQRDATLETFRHSVVHYAALKTVVCVLTGVAAGLLTWALQVDLPLMLGFLAFALNYIPNLGSWLAGIPAVLLAFIAWGPEWALLVIIGYLLINIAGGNVIEPRLMGHGLGLSPLVILLALMVFGWLLGPIGVVLAVPLLMVVRLALASSPDTRRYAYLFESAGSVRAALRAREVNPPTSAS